MSTRIREIVGRKTDKGGVFRCSDSALNDFQHLLGIASYQGSRIEPQPRKYLGAKDTIFIGGLLNKPARPAEVTRL
ncbi:MAG TPA: hypothetical protein VFW87_02980 [Pirellulales bacterium]|nr:hypothetical protein [Pirellulales bacterium]